MRHLRVMAIQFDVPGDALPRPHDNCYWLVPGLVLAGEHPGVHGEATLPDRLDAMLRSGVREWLNLTQPVEPLPDYAATARERAGPLATQLALHREPVHDYDVPAPATMRRIIDCVDAAIQTQRPIYLHCHGGIGRTGTAVGCWLVEQGLSGDEALALIQRKWQVMAKRDRAQVSPETEDQRNYILNWMPGAGRQRV
jgi:predicted protein tyrosine phosphatase